MDKKNASKEPVVESPTDSLLVLFWNLENFFDTENEGKSESDLDFSPEGTKRWSPSRFYRKCGLIAKSLLWISSRSGRIPDVVGFAEVENKRVLYRLLNSTALRKMGFNVVHYDSPDPRGIDVALLYRKSRLKKKDSHPIRLSEMSTRDLLHVCLSSVESGRIYDFIVCHLPSKYGGSSSEPRRLKVAARLRSVVDSLRSIRESDIVVMGDFNDVPTASSFDTLRPVLNLILPAKEKSPVSETGTIRFNGKWEWIDLFWTDFHVEGMEIVRLPFLMREDPNFGGRKPLRTYSGPRYSGGVSDHCPILMKVEDLPGRNEFFY